MFSARQLSRLSVAGGVHHLSHYLCPRVFCFRCSVLPMLHGRHMHSWSYISVSTPVRDMEDKKNNVYSQRLLRLHSRVPGSVFTGGCAIFVPNL